MVAFLLQFTPTHTTYTFAYTYKYFLMTWRLPLLLCVCIMIWRLSTCTSVKTSLMKNVWWWQCAYYCMKGKHVYTLWEYLWCRFLYIREYNIIITILLPVTIRTKNESRVSYRRNRRGDIQKNFPPPYKSCTTAFQLLYYNMYSCYYGSDNHMLFYSTRIEYHYYACC